MRSFILALIIRAGLPFYGSCDMAIPTIPAMLGLPGVLFHNYAEIEIIGIMFGELTKSGSAYPAERGRRGM